MQLLTINKFPNVNLEGIKAMLNLTDETENTAYYKSVKIKAFSKAVQKMLKKGQSIEEIADSLDLKVEEVRKLAEKQD